MATTTSKSAPERTQHSPTNFVFSSAFVALALACSGEEPPKQVDECRKACPDTSGLDLTAPSISFAEDVMPIFMQSCSDQLCHGNLAGARADLYLGPGSDATATDIAAVYSNLAGPSKTAPSVQLVAPGAPDQSFLMHKVDGCQNALDLSCDAEPNLCREACGDPMPPLPRDTYQELAEEQKLVLRRWIAQGASP